MLNSLREWGERRSTRVFALKIAQKRLEFEGVCTVTCNHQGRMELQACAACEKIYSGNRFRRSECVRLVSGNRNASDWFPAIGMRQAGFRGIGMWLGWTKQLNRDKFNCLALSVSETENVQIFRRQYVRPEIFAGGE